MKSLSSMAPSLMQGKEPQAACCMRPCPPDGLPIMGPIPGTENALIAAGHNCWGILGAVRISAMPGSPHPSTVSIPLKQNRPPNTHPRIRSRRRAW